MTSAPSFSRKKFLLLIVALAILGGAAFAGYRSFFQTKATPVMTVEAVRGNIEKTVLATGTVKPQRLVAVGAQVSGRLVSLHVKEGDLVQQGDLIAEIDSVPQQNNLRTAEAALEYARAQKKEKEASLALARLTYNRQKAMLARAAVSQADYDTALAELHQIEAQIAQLDAQIAERQVSLETAKVDLGYTQITAPMSGTILAIVTQQGQTVNAVQSAPTIVVMGDLSSMIVRTEISEADITQVYPGQELFFTVLGAPEIRFEGTLETIEPAPESITSDSAITGSSTSSSSTTSQAIYYNGVFSVPNPDDKLKTYMTAEVHIIVGRSKDAVLIPAAALSSRRRDGNYMITVQEANGTLTQRFVEVGLNDRVTAEIISGLEVGERVVMGQAGAMSAAPANQRRGPSMGL